MAIIALEEHKGIDDKIITVLSSLTVMKKASIKLTQNTISVNVLIMVIIALEKHKGIDDEIITVLSKLTVIKQPSIKLTQNTISINPLIMVIIALGTKVFTIRL